MRRICCLGTAGMIDRGEGGGIGGFMRLMLLVVLLAVFTGCDKRVHEAQASPPTRSIIATALGRYSFPNK
jgi:hypothetical protein